MTVCEQQQVERRYKKLQRKVEQQLQGLQQQRVDQLGPTRLYLPIPWQPIIYEQPVTMFKVMAAQGGQFTSVFDSSVAYQLQQWTYARCGCSSSKGWPPLWSCLYAFPSAHQARSAIFPRSSQQQKGARVLCQVTVQGKGYLHPDGRVAVSRLRLDAVLEYIPKGPSERVVSVDYSIGGQQCSSLSKAKSTLREGGAGQHSSSRQQARGAPSMQLAAELQEAAWDAEG